MSTTDTDRLDVIIFGATGFTGAAACYDAVRLLKGLRWGVAGRNEAKLREVLRKTSERYAGDDAGVDLAATVEVLIADVGDEKSLQRMAERAKIIVNCCGPYRFYGEPVVRACIAAGTHQVDVSGEPQYIERMQIELNEAAREAGVFIISACGFDSIPADMGTVFAERKFAEASPDGDGVVNAVETYLRTWLKGGHTAGGALVHYGTWESAVHGLAHWDELPALRRRLHGGRRPETPRPRLAPRGALHRSSTVNGRWSVPFPGSDRSVVQRSQQLLAETTQKRPVQIRTYMAFDSLLHVIGLAIFGAVFVLLTRFALGRRLLLAHPRLFSGGLFSHAGPTEETQRNSWFSITSRVTGWSRRAAAAADSGELPDMAITTRVTGTNPGYGATTVALLLSAVTLLREADRVPVKGGVLAPGGAFAKTTLLERLGENGYTFEVLPEKRASKGAKAQ